MAEEGLFLSMTEEGFFLGLDLWPNVDIDIGLLVFYPPHLSICEFIWIFSNYFIEYIYTYNRLLKLPLPVKYNTQVLPH